MDHDPCACGAVNDVSQETKKLTDGAVAFDQHRDRVDGHALGLRDYSLHDTHEGHHIIAMSRLATCGSC